MLAVSEHCTAAVAKGGELYTWGHDSDDDCGQGSCGRLGHSFGKDVNVPTKVTGGLVGAHVVSVALGHRHGAAVTTDGQVFTWGMGLRNTSGSVIPALVGGALTGRRVISVSAAEGFTVALTDVGKIWAWGASKHGTLGLGTINMTDIPTCVEGELIGKHVVCVTASSSHTLAVTSKGEVFSWGMGYNGCLGHGNVQHKLVPTCVEGDLKGLSVVAVSAEDCHSAAVTKEGKLFFWGASYDHTLTSDSEESMTLIPTLVEGALADKRVISVSVGCHHMAAVTKTGECYIWGSGAWGRLGLGEVEDRFSPTLVRGALRGQHVVEVTAGKMHSAVVTLEGNIYTWGGGKAEEVQEFHFHSDLYKLGHGLIDDTEWSYRPRLVSQGWFVDRSRFRACNGCGSTIDVKRCKCLKVFFCSKRCQEDAWPTHKLACKATREATKS